MDDWLRWPSRCSAIVERKYEEVPCDKPAIAVAVYNEDEFEPHAFPVCKHHARGRTMMPLPEVIAAAIRDADTRRSGVLIPH